ncbi:hypothetical protein C8R43DRAFT_949884 [Mycena crocata]|nr:hypothetical protein C8R43DRAFT_949884 [Mycena crocata]
MTPGHMKHQLRENCLQADNYKSADPSEPSFLAFLQACWKDQIHIAHPVRLLQFAKLAEPSWDAGSCEPVSEIKFKPSWAMVAALPQSVSMRGVFRGKQDSIPPDGICGYCSISTERSGSVNSRWSGRMGSLIRSCQVLVRQGQVPPPQPEEKNPNITPKGSRMSSRHREQFKKSKQSVQRMNWGSHFDKPGVPNTVHNSVGVLPT